MVRTGDSQAGYSLLELVISLFVATFVIVAALGLFDSANRISHTQTGIAEVQVSLRNAQHDLLRLIRMAGRGGLSGGRSTDPAARQLALEVRNNVEGESGAYRIAGDDSPAVKEGSDVLILRGVFTTPIYHVDYRDPATFTYDGSAGSVEIRSSTPTGVEQDLSPLLEAIERAGEGGGPEALILVSALDDTMFGVAELDGEASVVDDGDGPASLTLGFRTTRGTHATSYAALSAGGSFPDDIGPVAFVGLLEEHRVYVREREVVSEGSTVWTLSRARLYPNTDTPYENDPKQLHLDIADHILDQQIALGFDSPYDGERLGTGYFDYDDDNVGADDRIVDLGNETDDWLFNSEGDDETRAPWSDASSAPPLHYVRVSLLGKTPRPERGYRGDLIERLEDHVYGSEETDAVNGLEARMCRRRILQTVIDVRNLS